MIWLSLYAAAALVIGAALFVLAAFGRAPGNPAPQHPAVCALVAGALWPVLLIGAAQCGLILAVCHRLCRAAAPSAGAPARFALPVR